MREDAIWEPFGCRMRLNWAREDAGRCDRVLWDVAARIGARFLDFRGGGDTVVGEKKIKSIQ